MPASQQLCLEHLKQTLLAALLRPLLLAVASERPELGRGPRRGRRRGSWIDSRPYKCEMLGSQTYERRVGFFELRGRWLLDRVYCTAIETVAVTTH